ncbi:MAG: hypothetical protein L6Q84_10420, partial [Polyangiaceae bacterium]|nr:hypothetical protein [Polyangiaceae bacterium]
GGAAGTPSGGNAGSPGGGSAGAPVGGGGVPSDASAGGGGTGGVGAGGAGGSCPLIAAAPKVDPWAMRLPAAGFGGIETKVSGGHTDVFLKSPTDYIRIGARLDWGGTVVFFGLSANPGSNVIDANDTGRELQIAIYDPTRARQPCAWNASCQSSSASCGNSITFLGWNPVQGGDECNHGAKLISQGKSGDALEVVIQPLQWNPDWDAKDCVKSACGASGVPVQVLYKSRFRFVTEHVVEVENEVTSQEAISHPSTAQEFPTLYVSNGKGGPDLPVLLDASGKTITLATPGNDGFFYDNFSSAGPWVTWQDTNKTYGVGLAMDQGVKKFQGWRGGPPSAPYFHNVRAEMLFGLPAGGMVRGLSYLALGGFGTVKAELDGILKKRAPFGVVDTPAADVKLGNSSSVSVSGWVLDTQHVASVKAQIDGQDVATFPVDVARADVCAVYPMYEGCPAVGYSGQVPVGTPSTCPRLLRMVAVDADGNTTVLGERVLLP